MEKKTVQLDPDTKFRLDNIAKMLNKDRNETVEILVRLWEDIFLPKITTNSN